MKYTKTIIFLIFVILILVFFYAEVAPEIKRINDNNKKIVQNNRQLHDDMDRSFKNYESTYNENTKTRYWNEIP